MRSHPDNYFLTQWEKHFKNIRDFIPAGKQLGYTGMILTSWSTSGLYSPVVESTGNIVDLYPIRRVYPLSGFSMLLRAYSESVKSDTPLAIEPFVQQYANTTYGFSEAQAAQFWRALTTAPYEVKQGQVVSPQPMSIQTLLDSSRIAAKTLRTLAPAKGQIEFDHYRLMADMRVAYLTYQQLEHEVNDTLFAPAQIPAVLTRLKTLMAQNDTLSNRFVALNKPYYHPAELTEETSWQTVKPRLLYDRLARTKNVTPTNYPLNNGH